MGTVDTVYSDMLVVAGGTTGTVEIVNSDTAVLRVPVWGALGAALDPAVVAVSPDPEKISFE